MTFSTRVATPAALVFLLSCSATDQHRETAAVSQEPGLTRALSEKTEVKDESSSRAAADPTGPTESQAELETAPLGSAALEPAKHFGTDSFLNTPQQSLADVEPEDEGYILSFENADLREVIRVVLEDMLDLGYVFDPRVQGTVSLQTTRPLSRDGVLSTLEALLRMNGAALILDNQVYKVVPSDEALRAQVVPTIGGSGTLTPPGYTVQVVPLQYISAVQMERLLEPFLPPEGILRADYDRNLIVLAGTSQELANLVETIEIFDADWLAGMSVGIFPLTNVGAEILADELDQVFRSSESGPLAGLIQLTPIARLNALLVVTTRASYLNQVESWIERLDRGNLKGQNLYVYYLQHGKASDIAEILGEAFSSGGTESAEAAYHRRAYEPDDAGFAPADAKAPDRQGMQQDQPESAALEGPVPDLGAYRSHSADDGFAYSDATDIRIIPDEVNNALLIVATPADYRIIEATLRKLDVIPLQVLIEATIVEVVLSDELRYGVQWFFETNDFGLPGFGSGTLSSSASAEILPTFPGFSFVAAESGIARLVLDSLEGVTTVNVVSSPHLMVLDNQTAELQVGDEVPVITQQQQSTADPDAPLVNTVQFRDTGVILRVTPRVSASGSIIMEIEQEVSDVAPTTTSGIDSPTISQRKIKSSVVVHSGDTVVLGGLIDESQSQSSNGLPFLSTLPVVGALFGRKEENAERTELLVLISPRVVRNPEEARNVTRELRQRMQGLKLLDRLGKKNWPMSN